MSTENKPRFSAGQWVYAVIDYARLTGGGSDESGNWHNGESYTAEVRVQKLLVLKVTPHGAWIDHGEERRWVGFSTKKVHETPAGALANTVARRQFHIKALERKLKEARTRLAALQSFKVD